MAKPSYHRGVPRKLEVHALTKAQLNVPAEPAVTHVKPAQMAPARQVAVAEPEAPAPKPQAPKPGLLSRLKIAIFGEETASGERKEEPVHAAQRGKPEGKRDRQDGRNNPRQNAQGRNKQKQGNRAERPERSEEERRQQDEQRKLEQQKRREEQQKREAERKEAQRAENQRREAERRAQREAEAAAKAAGMLATEAPEDENVAAQTVVEAVAGENAAPNAEVNSDGTPRRRRGRRGGRRRRRQEGDAALDPNAANDQSEMDFDDGDDVVINLDAPESGTPDLFGEPKSPANTVALVPAAAVIAAAAPVSQAESDFSDLDVETPAVTAPVATPAPEAVAVAEPAPVEAVSIEPASVAAPDAEVPEAPAEAAIEPQPVAAEPATPEPKQPGYVPAAPPSFAMPSTPNTGFDFTVRISPENKGD